MLAKVAAVGGGSNIELEKPNNTIKMLSCLCSKDTMIKAKAWLEINFKSFIDYDHSIYT